MYLWREPVPGSIRQDDRGPMEGSIPQALPRCSIPQRPVPQGRGVCVSV